MTQPQLTRASFLARTALAAGTLYAGGPLASALAQGGFGGSDVEIAGYALRLEDTGVSAYNGAATRVTSKDVLLALASIAQVEARHAGALRQLVGESPTIGAFDRVFSGAQADAAVHRLTSG